MLAFSFKFGVKTLKKQFWQIFKTLKPRKAIFAKLAPVFSRSLYVETRNLHFSELIALKRIRWPIFFILVNQRYLGFQTHIWVWIKIYVNILRYFINCDNIVAYRWSRAIGAGIALSLVSFKRLTLSSGFDVQVKVWSDKMKLNLKFQYWYQNSARAERFLFELTHPNIAPARLQNQLTLTSCSAKLNTVTPLFISFFKSPWLKIELYKVSLKFYVRFY